LATYAFIGTFLYRSSLILQAIKKPDSGLRIWAANKIAVLVLLVADPILLHFGWQSSQSVGDQISETLTDSTMLFLIIGAAAAVTGILMAVIKR